MKLNNIQKAILTIGVLVEVILVVDWVADKDWLVPAEGNYVSWQDTAEMFSIWSIVVTGATWGLVLLWKSKK